MEGLQHLGGVGTLDDGCCPLHEYVFCCKGLRIVVYSDEQNNRHEIACNSMILFHMKKCLPEAEHALAWCIRSEVP